MANPIGVVNKDTFWVYDGSTWQEFPEFEYFKISKKQNQISEFEVGLFDVSAAQRLYFKEQQEVLFFCGTIMVLKGRIQSIEYGDAYQVIARGYGMECKLLDKEYISSGENRIQFDNTSAKTIVDDINSDILLTTNAGIFATDYGNISMRYEYANRLNALGKTCEAIGYNWWVSHTSSNTYSTNILNVNLTQGSTASAKTFNLTSNATFISQEKDINNLVNYVHALGYGDGINQINTSVYAASTQSSFLSTNIASTNTTITCSSVTPFNSTGAVRIAEEVINYTGRNTTTSALTGCTRGVSASTARAHYKNCYIEQHYLTSTAQTASSIGIYGVMDYTHIDKTILDLETLEVMASGYLSDHKSPIVRISITSDEPLTDATLNIGDLITVTSSEAGVDGTYHIVSQEYNSNYGVLDMTTEVSNRSLEFIEQMNKSREAADAMAKYMQGATNIYAISEAENCDSSHYLNMRFFIPNEAIAINKVLLNFNMENYRAYETGSAGVVAAISNYATDTFTGTMSSGVWEDTGGEVTITKSAGESVLVLYSCGLDQGTEPFLSELDAKVQKKIGAGAYADLTGSISYWGNGELNGGSVSRTSSWVMPGSGFLNSGTDTNDFDNGVFTVWTGTVAAGCPVLLPNGAVVATASISGYGTYNWYLYRDTFISSGSPTAMASGSINNTAAETTSTDTTITSPTINNSLYRYWTELYPMNDTTEDTVDAFKIIYTETIPTASYSDVATQFATLSKTILDTASSTGSISYKVQVQGESGDAYGTVGSGTITAIVFSNDSHTHGLGYGIYEETLTSPTTSVYTGINGGSMTLKGAYTSSQTELDLTTESSAVGAGNWMDIQFRPNKNMRIEANAYVQTFIKSE